jgi:hypothetical protein
LPPKPALRRADGLSHVPDFHPQAESLGFPNFRASLPTVTRQGQSGRAQPWLLQAKAES